MKKFSVIQYWSKGTSFSIKFQSDEYVVAHAALSMFRHENPDSKFAIMQVMD